MTQQQVDDLLALSAQKRTEQATDVAGVRARFATFRSVANANISASNGEASLSRTQRDALAAELSAWNADADADDSANAAEDGTPEAPIAGE
jgi:hypothetical protein